CMIRRFTIFFFILVTLGFFTAASSKAQTSAKNQVPSPVRSAADTWMDLIDTGNYEQAWEDASPIFKSKISKDYWRGLMAGRSVDGEVLARRMSGANMINRLPGFPESLYWLMQYDLDFDGGSRSETVALKADGGEWHVVSYGRMPIQPRIKARIFPLSK